MSPRPEEDRSIPPQAAVKPCAICGKPQVARFAPFCSRRCANVDLNRWLSGAYAIPGAEGEAEPGEAGERDESEA
jgi:uncharacterized protein